MSKLRMAVVGAGHLGKFHARLLSALDGVELVAVADPVQAAREAVAAECHTRPVADFRELIGQIDAAVIAAPTRLHHAIALELIAAGIHVLVEKPIAVTLSEADEMIAAARRRQVVLQVGHIERFNPALQHARPKLGTPKYLEAARHTPYTFRSTDIGVVLDLMIHDIDVALSLVGAEVTAVQALGVSVMGEHEDIAQARLTFASGCVANLSASRVSYQPKRQLQVWSDRGFASVDYATRATAIIEPGSAIAARQFDQDRLTAAEKEHFKAHLFDELLPLVKQEAEPRNAMLDELCDFADAVRQRRSPQVTGEHGRAALAVAYQILDAIAAHAWDGRSDGRVGPRLTPQPGILKGPHWDRVETPTRRAAG